MHFTKDLQSVAFDQVRSGGDVVMKHGVVMPDENATDPSLYKVNIGDMTASADAHLSDGIWCTNGMSPFVRYRDMNNTPISMGSYTPIAPFTPVTVIIPNGGAGQGIIVGPAKTNVGLPDPENREHLHMIAQTPKKSWIAIDDKTSNIQVMFEGGQSSIVLAENLVSLEIGKGENSGVTSDTSLKISSGGFVFKTRDSTMKFDEGGFSVAFDAIEGQEKASSFLVSRDSIKAQGGKSIQLNAQDSFSTKAEKITIQGIKDASISANHAKLNGAQVTSIKGNQIEVEGFWNVQLKGMHVGLQASVQYKEQVSMKYSKNMTSCNITKGVAAHKALSNNVWATATNLQFSLITGITPKPRNIGAPAAMAVSALQVVNEATHKMLKAVGTAWMVNAVPIAVITNVLGTGYAMAGAGNRSENESKTLTHADDTKSTKSINSGIATAYTRKNDAMENLSVVDPLIEKSLTALYTGGASPSSIVSPQKQWALESGIAGIAEASCAPSGPTMGMDAAGITMTDSCSLLAPSGTCSTLRKCCSGCTGYGGATTKQCGSDGFNAASAEQDKATNPFASKMITGEISTSGGTCGVPPGCSGAATSGGASTGCASGNTGYGNSCSAPGCLSCG